MKIEATTYSTTPTHRALFILQSCEIIGKTYNHVKS